MIIRYTKMPHNVGIKSIYSKLVRSKTEKTHKQLLRYFFVGAAAAIIDIGNVCYLCEIPFYRLLSCGVF